MKQIIRPLTTPKGTDTLLEGIRRYLAKSTGWMAQISAITEESDDNGWKTLREKGVKIELEIQFEPRLPGGPLSD